MISVVTPTYNTPPDVLARTWASLKKQTHTDWEWVIWDDSTKSGVWEQVYGFCADERYKISMYRSHVHSGSIGKVKRDGFMVASGDLLVELDHDDELTPTCLEELAKAAAEHPDCGFFYSDWCELLTNGESGRYPDGWAFGFGDHYWCEDHGVWAMKAPEINPTTIRHIVSAPNHVRCWRSDVYRALGGHDQTLTVADDYELIVRTALATKFCYVPKMLYKQHIGPHTAQRQRNNQIQQLVAEIADRYDSRLRNVGL